MAETTAAAAAAMRTAVVLLLSAGTAMIEGQSRSNGENETRVRPSAATVTYRGRGRRRAQRDRPPIPSALAASSIFRRSAGGRARDACSARKNERLERKEAREAPITTEREGEGDEGVSGSGSGLGFVAVVDFATSDFETCPKYQNWANFINKSTTESQISRS